MQTIWKRELEAKDVQDIEIPEGAEFLCAREQFENVCVWFRCDPQAPLKARRLAVCGTGHPSPDGRYIGTASLEKGYLIFHVFEQQL